MNEENINPIVIEIILQRIVGILRYINGSKENSQYSKN